MDFNTFDEAWEKTQQKWTLEDKPCSLSCLDEEVITSLIEDADEDLRYVDTSMDVQDCRFCAGYYYKSIDGSPERRIAVSIKQYESVEAAETGARFYLSRPFEKDPMTPVVGIEGRKPLGQRAWRTSDCIFWRHGTSMLFVKRFNEPDQDGDMDELILKLARSIEKHLTSLPCTVKEMSLTFTPRLKTPSRLIVKKGEKVVIELDEAPCRDNIHNQRYVRLWPTDILRPWPYEPVEKTWRFVAEEVGKTKVTLLVASKTLLRSASFNVEVEVLAAIKSE